MLLENWLYTGTLNIKTPYCPPLKTDIKTDCLVIGGGFAGLHAALHLVDEGRQVVLLEKRICGGSSSGRSAGFLTPESEEDIKQLIDSLGKEEAKIKHDIPVIGVKLIVDTIKKNKFDCDLRKQDSLYLSIKKSHDKFIEDEAETRKEMKLPYELYNEHQLKKIHPGKGYRMGLKYPGSYGVNSFAYTQEMKNLLIKKGVRIYEDTEVHKIDKNTAITHLGSAKANNIIVCIDKMKSEFNEEVSKNYYHIQSFLTISEPMSEDEMSSMFPKEEMMCWNTKLFYIHYRPVQGNRLILGGSSLLSSYHKQHHNSPSVINTFIKEIKDKFPQVSNLRFTNYWMGLIDVTKDFTPIVDYDKDNESIQYVLGCAGLPFAAFCGDHAAKRITKKTKQDLGKHLGMHREFLVPNWLQSILGKRISFGLSHLRELLK